MERVFCKRARDCAHDLIALRVSSKQMSFYFIFKFNMYNSIFYINSNYDHYRFSQLSLNQL